MMIVRSIQWLVLGLTCGIAAACSAGQSGSLPNVATPDVATTSTLQFAVGTATIAMPSGTAQLGLNVVTTFRQPNGNNATGVNTPTLKGPPGLTFDALLGGTNSVAGVTPAQLRSLAGQVSASPAPAATPYPLLFAVAKGFGPYVGAFGYGLAADNLLSNSDLNTVNQFEAANATPCLGIATGYASNAVYGQYLNIGVVSNGVANGVGSRSLPGDLVRSAELAVPIPSGVSTLCTCPSTCAANGTPFAVAGFPQQYFGGPPAWPTPQGYGGFSYFVGYPLGFTDFIATPVPGAYSMSVAFPTSSDYSTFGTITKTAQLPAATVAAPLPMFAQPSLTVNADGSGVVTVAVPPRVSEAVVTIATNDCDLAGRDVGGSTVYVNHYALVTKTPGTQTLFLSADLGPPSTVTALPTHTFCTASDLAAYNAVAVANGGNPQASIGITTTIAAVGFDYPAYESSYPFNLSAAPPITNGDGHTGQADITTSFPLTISTTISAPTGS